MTDDFEHVEYEVEYRDEVVDRSDDLKSLDQATGTGGISSAAKRKSVLLAGLLNFLVPGAGMLYLGKPWLAAVNFIILLIAGSLQFFLGAYIRIGSFGLATFVAIGSCAWAIGEAKKMNRRKQWHQM